MGGKTSTASKRKYHDKTYKRIVLDVRTDIPQNKEAIQEAAIQVGESLTEYILESVRRRMTQDTQNVRTKEQDTPAGELKITDTPSHQDKALSCSISPAQKKALEEVLCSIIQDTPRDQRDALKVELNQIICECTDKINNSKNTLSYTTLL